MGKVDQSLEILKATSRRCQKVKKAVRWRVINNLGMAVLEKGFWKSNMRTGRSCVGDHHKQFRRKFKKAWKKGTKVQRLK